MALHERDATVTIKVGDTLPSVKLTLATRDGPREVSTEELFAGKLVVLFGVPGAFTPTCSAQHLPGFVENLAALKAKGVELVACMAVNDVFVMDAWGKANDLGDSITLLADGSCAFTHALGLELDLTNRGLGIRCQRFALVADDLKITHLGIEPPGDFGVSRAESVLAAL